MSSDEKLAEAIQRAMEAQAAQVEVSPDALVRIRTRIRTRPWWASLHGVLGAGAAAVAAGGAATVVLVAGTGGPPDAAPDPPPAVVGPPSASPSPSPSPSAVSGPPGRAD